MISDYINIQTLELLPNGIIVYRTGEGANLLYANRAALRICECDSLEEMKSFCRNDYLNFFHPEDYKHHIDIIQLAWQSENDFDHHVQYRIITKKNNVKMIDDSGKMIDIPQFGRCYICVLTAMDRQITYDELNTADKLTGLLSMGQFIQYCENFLQTAAAKSDNHSYHIAFFNIRRFKEYNVEYGSQKGDFVLQSLARILTKWSTTKVVSRMGSDQFVVISESQEMYDRIHKVIDEFAFEYGAYGLFVDVGIYPIFDYQQDIHAACDLAKVACDSIRSSKKNICVYYDALSQKIHVSNYVIQHLDEAIENQYIKVYYQPVIRTLTGQLCGMEALARWIDPIMGFLSPGDFISVLENNHLITKLDLFMLETICKEMKQAEAAGQKMLPVSFNLSRIDFVDFDIFAEVEKIVKKYSVPRDMLNIEITESMVMDDADVFRKDIEQFRAGGYQVWMDDFGSGYSSLNVLKDFRFDEIKLDMKFLTNLDENSKTIIQSIILMAKQLGVQTLAEGVETQEQFEFLRKIGCEKAQGYLFSKPLPINDLRQKMDTDGIQPEMRGRKDYYNQVGAVNFITDRSLAIVEFNGKNFEYLFVNSAYREIWENLGVNDMKIVYQSTNSMTSPLGRQLRDVQSILHKGEHQEITASIRGQYVRLDIHCLAEYEDNATYTAEITNLTDNNNEKRERLDNVFRMMYALYDSIYLLDMNNGTFETLIHGASNNLSEYKDFHDAHQINPLKAALVFIHPNEREEYARFSDADTIVERLKSTDCGYITQYFRTLTGNGAYVWKAHTMLYIPTVNSIIYCSQYAYFTQPGLIERVAPEYLADSMNSYNKGFHQILRQGIMESKSMNLFWKDNNHRFLGANEKFLTTYGFSDVNDIVGKTDEDIGWNIDIDESYVLERGTVITNKVTQCIIKGVAHTIIMNKEPLYDNGKIVGLIGSFVTMDSVDGQEGIRNNTGIKDMITGLMSANGMTDQIGRYAEEWQVHKENFAVVRVSISEYYRASRSYGQKIAKQMLREMGKLISDVFGMYGICARLFAGNFAILMKCLDKHKISELAERIRIKLEQIHTLAGYSATINPTIEIYYADEVEDLHAIIGIATGGTALDMAEHKMLEEELNIYDIQMNTIIDALPGGIAIHEIMDDGSFKVIYASSGVGRLSGRSIQEFKDDVTDNNTTGMVEKDIMYVHQAVQQTVHEGKALDVCYRIYDVHHRPIWINMKGRVIGEQNGHPMLLAVFQNISDATQSYETALDEALVGVMVCSSTDGEVLYQNRSAKDLVDEFFGGSVEVLQSKMNVERTQNQTHYRYDIDEMFEWVCQGKHLFIRISESVWNGRQAKVIYLMDITARFNEQPTV